MSDYDSTEYEFNEDKAAAEGLSPLGMHQVDRSIWDLKVSTYGLMLLVKRVSMHRGTNG